MTNSGLGARLGRLGRYREMASDVMWSGASDLLIMMAQLSSFILLGRNLPLDRYGGYVGLYGIIGPIGALSWAGLQLLVMQQILREERDRAAVSRATLTLLLGQGLLALVATLAIAQVTIGQLSVLAILLFGVVDLLFAPLVMTTAAFRQALVSFPSGAKLRIALVGLRASVLAALWVAGQLTLVNLSAAWTVVLGGFAAYCLLKEWPALGLTPRLARPGRPELITNVELSFPMASSNLQKDGDKAVLNYFGYSADAGIYGAAFRIVWMAQMPIQTLNNALFHRFLSHDDRVKGLHVQRATRFTVVSLAVSVAVGAALWVVAPLLPLVMGDKFDESVEIVRLLVWFLPLTAVSRAPLNGLLGLKANTERAAILIGSAAFALVLYVSLIPDRSWEGAIIGTLLAEAMLGLSGWWVLLRKQRIEDERAEQRRRMAPDGTDEAVATGAVPGRPTDTATRSEGPS